MLVHVNAAVSSFVQNSKWWMSSHLIMSLHVVLAVLHDHLSHTICSIDMNVVERNSIMSLSECFHLIIVCWSFTITFVWRTRMSLCLPIWVVWFCMAALMWLWLYYAVCSKSLIRYIHRIAIMYHNHVTRLLSGFFVFLLLRLRLFATGWCDTYWVAQTI